jgi:predicted kinase
MIISLRGTSGAGKSHLARSIFEQYQTHREIGAEGRHRPLYTLHGRLLPDGIGRRTLMVPGHYLIANGGIDTLSTLDEAYGLARWANGLGHDVLMEGKCMSDGAARIVERARAGADARVVHINTPLEECVASVRARGHMISPQSIEKTYRKVERDIEAILAAGLRVFVGDRAQCKREIEGWLGL